MTYLFGYLVLEIERMAVDGWKTRRAHVVEHGTKWKNSFRWGAVNAIGQRLHEQNAAREATANTCALVLVRQDEAAVEQALEERKLGKPLSGTKPSSGDGYWQGHRAGQRVQMSASRGALEGSKKRIGAEA